jgi:energy-coupling factor transporter transmembrane protein EcfT
MPVIIPAIESEAVNVSAQDINQTLEYRSTTAIVRLLPTGLLLIFLGLILLALADYDREVWTLIGIVLCLAVGVALVGVTLWRRWNSGKPLFTLSPAGIHYRVPMVKEVLIPWQEIQGVDTIDIEAGYWSIWSAQSPILSYHTWLVRDVTVVLLPKPFYDRQIFVDSFLLRGPGWNANFIVKGALVQMALHHELVSVEPRPLREAVEARWLAFRERPALAPASGIMAMGDDPKAMSPWEAIKVIVPLIGIAIVLSNLIGLWDLPGQDKVREVRAKAREERKYWDDSARRRKEESKRLEAEDKERREEFERDMRRVFGR